MSAVILIEPENLWNFVQERMDEIEVENYEIGNFNDAGIVVYVGVNRDTGMFSISVEADDVLLYEEDFFNEEDCEKTCRNIYDVYLTKEVYKEILADGEEYDEESDFPKGYKGNIAEREDTLDVAAEDFFDVIMENCASDSLTQKDRENVIKDLKEHALEYMARKHGLDIYRPMILVKLDDKGNEKEGSEYYSDYPYGELYPDAELY